MLEVGLPAHVVAKHAIGVKDPAKAKSALISAVQHRTMRDLAAISRFWNSGFNLSGRSTAGRPADLLLGTGPYTITDIVADDHLTLTANPGTTETTNLASKRSRCGSSPTR